MQLAKPITPCLWFDTRAEEAANFYCAIFKNSKIMAVRSSNSTRQCRSRCFATPKPKSIIIGTH